MAKRGRRPVRVIISPSERTTLEQWAKRRTTAQGPAQRARIVLECATGRSAVTIARELRITRQTVGRWRQRFVERRLDGLVDEPRPGAPRRVTDAQVEQVIIDTLEKTPRDATHWSTRTLATELDLSHATIGKMPASTSTRRPLVPAMSPTLAAASRKPRNVTTSPTSAIHSSSHEIGIDTLHVEGQSFGRRPWCKADAKRSRIARR